MGVFCGYFPEMQKEKSKIAGKVMKMIIYDEDTPQNPSRTRNCLNLDKCRWKFTATDHTIWEPT
ncbi:MAG: hypothetical protein CMN56_08190 [Sneathiella sp.]|nr:hypothetical protein [Sneathiella sp.]